MLEIAVKSSDLGRGLLGAGEERGEGLEGD